MFTFSPTVNTTRQSDKIKRTQIIILSLKVTDRMTIKKFKSINLSEFRLVVTSASVGNVGQLTADLIIETLKMEKIGMVLKFNFHLFDFK